METFKRELVLHDKNGTKHELTITNENGHFSICNTHGQNEFEPKNNLQQQLLDVWHTYHLNGMSSGTKEQDEALEKVGLKSAYDYTKACEHLKSLGLYEVDYKGAKYRYGSGWIYLDMPDNFEETLFSLLDALQDEEDKYNERLITIDDLNKEEFINHADENCDGEVEKLMAACLECEVSWDGLENVTTEDGKYWNIEGQDYSIYTAEEADDAHFEDIQNFVDDVGFEGFSGGNCIDVNRLPNGNIEVSKSIEIPSYERAGALAGYDGEERTQEINGTRYYLYKT